MGWEKKEQESNPGITKAALGMGSGQQGKRGWAKLDILSKVVTSNTFSPLPTLSSKHTAPLVSNRWLSDSFA